MSDDICTTEIVFRLASAFVIVPVKSRSVNDLMVASADRVLVKTVNTEAAE